LTHIMTRNLHVNHSPPYQNDTLNHSVASYTDAHNNQSNLLFRQHPNYSSVLAPREAKKSHCILTKSLLLGFFLLIATSLVVIAISFSPAHDEIRNQWKAEKHYHQVLRYAGNPGRKAMAVEIAQRRKKRADPENRELWEEEEKRSSVFWENILLS